MNNIEMIKDKASQAEVMTRKIFLAGLGAYGKSFEQTKSRFESLTTESSKMFADLVAKGEKLETEGKSMFTDVQTKISVKADLDNRVEALRTKLGLNKTDADDKIEALNAKIDSLTTAVAKLTSKPVAKRTAKVAVAK
jgi:polyhydroxyalkanoate synthesis regulator phasin